MHLNNQNEKGCPYDNILEEFIAQHENDVDGIHGVLMVKGVRSADYDDVIKQPDVIGSIKEAGALAFLDMPMKERIREMKSIDRMNTIAVAAGF